MTDKKDERFIVHTAEPLNGGPPLDQLRASFLTPTERFFARNHAPIPEIDPATFRLTIDGAVKRPLLLSLADLQRDFPSHERVATLQCAGNRRAEMLDEGQRGQSVPWGSEAIGNARWQGARLADVLAAAGPLPEAAHLSALGLDDCTAELKTSSAETDDEQEKGFGGSIPLAKALAPETLLAYGMNGAPLPALHGGPLRLLVPGYIGARSVKWLARLTLAAAPSANHYQARSYRVFPPAVNARNVVWGEGESLGPLWVNSVICLPAPGQTAPAGPLRIAGYAQSRAPIVTVEVSADGGQSWRAAALTEATQGEPPSPWAWCFWETTLHLPPGEHELCVRAWDAEGNGQPADLAPTWNFKGYRIHHWQRRRLIVE